MSGFSTQPAGDTDSMSVIKEFLDFLKDIFRPVRDSGDTTVYLRGVIVRILTSLIFTAGILVILVGLLWQAGLERALLFGSVLISLSVVSQILFRKGQVRMLRIVIVLALFASLTWFVVTGGGLTSPSFTAIYVVLIIAGLVLSNRTFLFAFFYCIALTAGVTWLETSGNLPAPSIQHVPYSRMLIHFFLLFMTLTLIYLFTNVVRKALKRASDEAVKRSGAESDIHVLFNSVDLAVAVTSVDGRILMVNQTFSSLFTGSAPDDLKEQSVYSLIGGKTRTEDLNLNSGQPHRREFRHRPPGTALHREYEILVKPIHFRGADSLLFTFSDITDMKQIYHDQNAMIDRSRRQRSALIKISLSQSVAGGDFKSGAREITENAAHAIKSERVSIWLGKPKSGRLTCLDLYQSSRQEHSEGQVIESRDYPRYFQTLTLSRVIDANLATEDLRTREFAETYLKPNGITSMLDAPIRVSGQIEGIVCIEHVGEPRVWLPDEIRFAGEIADHIAQSLLLFERKKAESALLRTEERYRVLVEHLPESAVLLYDRDLRFLLIDGPEVARAGFDKALLMGKTVSEVFPPEYASIFVPLMSRVFNGDSFSKTLPYREFIYTYHYVPLEESDGTIQYGLLVARNVTEKKRAEEEIQRSEERYRDFFEEDLSGDFIATPDGKISDCNPSFMKIFGFGSAEDARSTNIVTLFRVTSVWKSIINQLSKGENLEYFEIEMVRVDGEPVYIIGNFNGKQDDEGRLRMVKGYLFDDTRRRELETQLIQSQKMQSIGTLAGGIAHDFNNLLGIIIGRTQILEMKVTGDQRLTKESLIIRQAAERGTSLVKQLLTFARKSEVKTERLKINHLVHEIEKLVAETFPKSVSLELTLKTDLPDIQADSTQIHQVLLNLCVNSRDAMPAGGAIRISTDQIEGDLLQHRYKNAVARSYIQLTVQDSGAGISPENLNRIYEPFFTTKDIGKGTGLGLSVVYGIVSSHNGFIHVESAPGKGTTFQIFLPVDELILDQGGSEPKEFALAPGGAETLLLIEDEQMLRDLVTETLTAKGYSVIAAQNGIEGIEVFQAQSDGIDMVISDYGLPVMNGSQVYSYLKQIKPGLKFILASGFIDPAMKSELSGQGIREFIEKPYRPEDLARRIRMVLDEGKPVRN